MIGYCIKLVKHLGFVFLCLIITANYWVVMIYCCVAVLDYVVSIYTSLGTPFVLLTPFTFRCCLPVTMSNDLNPPFLLMALHLELTHQFQLRLLTPLFDQTLKLILFPLNLVL